MSLIKSSLPYLMMSARSLAARFPVVVQFGRGPQVAVVILPGLFFPRGKLFFQRAEFVLRRYGIVFRFSARQFQSLFFFNRFFFVFTSTPWNQLFESVSGII